MTNATRPAFITCARCGTEKKVGRSGPLPTYCSAACRSTLSYERSREDGRYQQQLAGLRQKTAASREAAARPCPYCGSPMVNPRRKQCGKSECKRAFNAERILEWHRAYKGEHGVWPHHRYAAGQRAGEKRRRLEKGHWRKLYPECAVAYDARRRALIVQARTDEVFAPVDVHERDNWTCKLCLLPIDPSAAWPDPKSASLDHVIPLSRGGRHSMANVQSAHLGCNSSKGDRPMVKVAELLAVERETS